MMAWILRGPFDLAHREEILQGISCLAIVDCKSLYDALAVPNVSSIADREGSLDALVVRQLLQRGDVHRLEELPLVGRTVAVQCEGTPAVALVLVRKREARAERRLRTDDAVTAEEVVLGLVPAWRHRARDDRPSCEAAPARRRRVRPE